MVPKDKPKLEGFEFLEYLGGGAFGEVWKALDTKMKVLRAIKVLRRDRFKETDARRLLEESQKMAQLPKHRNRVAVHHFKEGITNSFLVMDFVSGGAISQKIAKGQPLPWTTAIRYAAGIADALLDVHARGLLHRDIKPDNILLDPELDEAVLSDFGIAIAADQVGRIGGTPGYIAPEVYRGVASARSDVFSLAKSLLHLVTGNRPRENTPSTDHPGWQSIPDELQQVLSKSLASDPEKRPDPATFRMMLREVRWKVLTDQMLAAIGSAPAPVNLSASIETASADEPTAFRPLFRDGQLQPAATGDFVKVGAHATAEGYLPVLVLGSSGDIEVALPSPAEPKNLFRAGQRCNLILQLTPPAGTERLLIHWSANSSQRTSRQWQEWLESIGLAHENAEAALKGRRTRGAELVRVQKGSTPEGLTRVLVIPVPHIGRNRGAVQNTAE